MSPTESLLPGVLAPAILAGLILGLAWRTWRAEGSDGRAFGGLAIGGGLFLANGLMFGWPALPVGDRIVPALERLAWIALALGPLLLLERPLGRLAPLVRVACAAGAIWWILDAFPGGPEPALFGGVLAGFVLLGAGLQLLARRGGNRSLSLALLVVGAASAVVIGLRLSGMIGQLEGALCAGLGAAWVLTLWRSRVTIEGPTLTAWVVLQGTLLTVAGFYELGPLDLLLLGAAPLAIWIAELPAIRTRPGWQVGALRVLFVAIPAGVALVRAILDYDPDPYGY